MEPVHVYRRLLKEFGPQGWWPVQNGFSPPEWEVCVGAILTQNTNWGNVEKSLSSLKEGGVTTPQKTLKVHNHILKNFIRSSGYYTQKAHRLKALAEFVSQFSRERDFLQGADRKDLLLIHGIGPETADSILLYATGRKFFVVDAYTRRIFSRFGMIKEDWRYDKIRLFFEKSVPKDADVYKEFHALIVRLAKENCRKAPICGTCPLCGPCRYSRRRKK
ncbi:MAG TPA: endonuclease [archaeon]|jgi:endonuclease-3 related protein|nr:endonuclease [archaeon]